MFIVEKEKKLISLRVDIFDANLLSISSFRKIISEINQIDSLRSLFLKFYNLETSYSRFKLILEGIDQLRNLVSLSLKTNVEEYTENLMNKFNKFFSGLPFLHKIGRASCRERV